MAHSKEDITYGTAQAKVTEDESLRVAYKHGTPIEAGKIAESEPVSHFSAAAKGISPPEPSSRPWDDGEKRSGMEAERPLKTTTGGTLPAVG